MRPAPCWLASSRSSASVTGCSPRAGSPATPSWGVKGPAQRRPIVLPLTDDQLRALIATCTSPLHRPGERLHHRRDEALIRLMAETGIRAGEVAALECADLDLDLNRISVRQGKGRLFRTIPVGSTTIAAIRGYLVERVHHRAAASPRLWLGSAAPASATTASTRPCAVALRRPASTASTCTGSATPPPTAGSPPAAPNPGSWPWPAGPAPTCSCATPAPPPPTGRPPKRCASTSGTSEFGSKV